jgi:hypothetical protein
MKSVQINRSATRSIILLLFLLAALLPAARTQAATPITVELYSIADARIQGGSPDNGFGSGFIWTGTPNGHLAYVQFDLLELPANATISSADLRLSFQGTYTGAANVEVGRNDGAWDEATVTWNTRPASTFNSNLQPVGDTRGDIVWPVTGLVNQWHNGTAPNYGFALRGDGTLKAFHSKETGCIPSTNISCDPLRQPPRLVVTYTVPPEEGPRPDLGDAPDSSNNVGINPNTAYPGIAGNFPTVWNGTLAGEPAGPYHANGRGEGFLGNTRSREVEADSGNDADGLNNILNGGADNANNDRGDDGWRNRNARFENCEQTTLRVRVNKASGATLDRMYLNVWFDGNRDGDWADRALCTPQGEALAIPAYEWIVQDYFVDMTGIPAGGYVDIDITTETVLNNTPDKAHWMRFTLSEQRAPQSANGRTDGRGPHPSVGSYQFGETEDYVQRPQPPGEDGTLELRKRIVNPSGNPLPIGGLVTYEIRLRHVGGSQPIQAQIRDEITEDFRIFPQIVNAQVEYIVVSSSTGGAAPLQADYKLKPNNPLPIYVVTWQGSLAPDSEITLSFLVQNLGLCAANQTVRDVRNVAQARPRGGTEITAEATFRAACPGYNPRDIEISPNPIEDPIDLDDLTTTPWSAEVWNRHPFTTTIKLYQTGASRIAQDNTGDTTIRLAPNERRDITLDVSPGLENGNPLDQTGDPVPITVGFCFLFENSPDCPSPERYPHYHGEAPPASYTPRSNDLGDAPDSSNHAGAAMAAYPGVPASFPTVFDPALGVPQGPRHVTPRPFHLGERVSREAEADAGPDQDPLNNIVPAANDPDNDRADDGSRLLNLAHCQPGTVEARVFISPQAAAWFQQQNRPAYLNVWLDGNRDGDWADGMSCGGGLDGPGPSAIEHIVIDAPIDVVGLGAGLHTLSFVTGRVPWPAQLAQRPSWVRFTLSERESNKTLSFGGISYGDGRGYAQPFRTGETEDYILRQQGDPDAAPDLGVGLRGRIVPDGGQNGNDQVGFKIDYANFGSQVAQGARLVLSKPEQLRDPQIILLRAPGIPAQNVSETADTVTIQLPDLPPGANNTIMLGWDVPAGQPPAGDYIASVEAIAAGDGSPANNTSEARIARPLALPSVAAWAGDDTSWGLAETTCRSDVWLTGVSIPNTLFSVWVDGTHVNDLQDQDDTWLYLLQNLSDGRHEVWLTQNSLLTTPRSNILRLNVDTSLPIDPLSLTFTDSQGNIYHPPTLNWRQLGSQVAASLRSGETYEIGIDSCVTDPNQQYDLVLPDGSPISLTDADGDGRFTGSFVFDASGSITPRAFRSEPPASELRLVATTGGASQTFSLTVQTQSNNRVLDAASNQPVEGVTVTTLSSTNVPLRAAALGRPNPQTTGADGRYSAATNGSVFRLLATRSGYQAYRSWEITGAQDINLRLELTGTPEHTIYLTANGFVPAVLKVQSGDLVEWVNLDLVEHGVRGAGLDSGALAPGQRYRANLSASGNISIVDAADPLNTGTLIVEGGQRRVFLPLIRR